MSLPRDLLPVLPLSVGTLPVLGFAAFSGTGKTTLLEMLIPQLMERGIRIAIIKHAHHDFDIDKPGKDSYRLRKAGATQLLICSRLRNALMTETPNDESTFTQLINRIDHHQADLLLVEGFKHEAIPKIELHRQALAKPWQYPQDANIIAIACDSSPKTNLPLLDINDVSAIAAYIIEWMKQQHTKQHTRCDNPSNSMLSVAQAQQIITDSLLPPRAITTLSLDDLYGRVFAQPIIAPINVPSSTNSAMDGYAIRSADIAMTSFTLVGEILAGDNYHKPLNKGQCLRIMTGAPIPVGADTVVMKEQARLQHDTVCFDLLNNEILAGQNVRQAGEDLQKGHIVFNAGTRIGSPELGLLASLGFNSATVFSQIKVALFSTGNEIQAPGTPPKENCIYDANRYTLRAMLQKLGCLVIEFGINDDNENTVKTTLTHAMEQADIIISSGGVSVGDADYIKSVLAELGEIHFWRVNMRPGRPLVFGTLQHSPFFGLPGNPVAAMITFLEFVEPAIRQMQGDRFWQPQRFTAITTQDIRSRIGRTEYSRGIYSISANGQLEVRSTGSQGSGILRSMSEANCLIQIPPESDSANTGDRVRIIPLASRL